MTFSKNLVVAALLAITNQSYAAYPENPQTAQTLASTAATGIRDFEIFQRDMPQNSTQISVRVSAQLATSTSSYTVSLLNSDGTRQSVLAEGLYRGSRMVSFTLGPQNTFKRVRVSFYDASGVERQRWDSPQFNVGEVFLVAGQSNVGNHGDTEGKDALFRANNIHRAIDPTGAGKWLPLAGPLPFTTSWDYPRNGSPWPAFADSLGVKLARTMQQQGVAAVPVAVLNVSYGGSSLEVWDPSATTDQHGKPMVLFNRLTLGANALKRLTPTEGVYKCGFRAVLWHQGESNSNRDFDKDRQNEGSEPSRKWYAAQLDRVTQSFRSASGCTQPWMIAAASWLAPHWRVDGNFNPSTKFDAEREIREGQLYLTRRDRLSVNDTVYVRGPDTDMLGGDDPATGGRKAYRSDGIHMNAQGLVLHGQMWAGRVAKMVDPKNQPYSTEKDVIPEAKFVWDAYTAELGRTPWEISLDHEGVRYWVQTLTMHPQIDLKSYFRDSDERYVRDTFARMLNRRPTLWEVNYWVKELGDGRVSRANLTDTDKVGFENTLSVNGKKAYLLYAQVMGRTPPQIFADMEGLHYWTNVLNRGVAEVHVRDSFLGSSEYTVRYAFVKTKGRQPSINELHTYMPMVNPNLSNEKLADLVWRNAGK